MLSYNELVEKEVIPRLKYLCEKVLIEKDEMTLEGIEVFKQDEPFVPGELVSAYSYVLVNTPQNSNSYPQTVNNMKKLVEFTSNFYMNTFGILGYLTGLYRLKKANILNDIIDEKTFDYLNSKLDWRIFVNETDLTLKNGLPFNYYSVAFRVAKFRELIGFETTQTSEKFLEIFLNHVEKNSSKFGYMDETLGEGRFDRYSIVVPAELCTQMSFVDMKIPEKLLSMLKTSAGICVNIANEKGDGIPYGRSIGSHGDATGLEVLPLAAKLGLLSDTEKEISYTYTVKILEKALSFWYDKEMNSINIWDKGRKTDSYRNKKRILEVNIDMYMKYVDALEEWKLTGFKDKLPSDNFNELLESIPKHKFYYFDCRNYERAMAIIRNKHHVFTIPFVNGYKYYNATPYLPIPYEDRVLETSPDTYHANLVPKLKLKNGVELMPLSFVTKITTEEKDNTFSIQLIQDQMCALGKNTPEPYNSIHCNTLYSFGDGFILREDTITSDEIIDIDEIYMEFSTFSKEPKVMGNKVTFNSKDIYEIEALNFETCSIESVYKNSDYNTSHGPLENKAIWKRNNIKTNTLKLCWKLKYR